MKIIFPGDKPSTKLLYELALVRQKIDDIEKIFESNSEGLDPLREVDKELSTRLLIYLSGELNIALEKPEDYPLSQDSFVKHKLVIEEELLEEGKEDPYNGF